MQQLNKPIYESKNEWLVIHKDDEGRIDRPYIVHDQKNKVFTYKSALKFLKSNKLSNDGMKSGWFITTRFALSRAKWAI